MDPEKLAEHLAQISKEGWPVKLSQTLLMISVVLLCAILFIGITQTKPSEVLQEIQDIRAQIEGEVKPSDVLKKVEQIETRLDIIQEQLMREGLLEDENSI